ncbi:MAG: hypothetical protein AABW71_00120 [Nanoarchaeota archaeon]
MIHSFSNEDRAGLGLAFTNSELENKYSISFFANHAGPEVKLGYRTLGKVDFSEDGETNAFGQLMFGGIKRGYADWAVGRTSNNADMFTNDLFTDLFGRAPIEGVPFNDRVDNGLVGILSATNDSKTNTRSANGTLAYVTRIGKAEVTPLITASFDLHGSENYGAGLQLKAPIGEKGNLRFIIDTPFENPEDVNGRIEFTTIF